MLPPPTTMASSAPAWCTSTISAAMSLSVAGLSPNPPTSPQRASPESLSKTRLCLSSGMGTGLTPAAVTRNRARSARLQNGRPRWKYTRGPPRSWAP
jgi:hypothetical protein